MAVKLKPTPIKFGNEGPEIKKYNKERKNATSIPPAGPNKKNAIKTGISEKSNFINGTTGMITNEININKYEIAAKLAATVQRFTVKINSS